MNKNTERVNQLVNEIKKFGYTIELVRPKNTLENTYRMFLVANDNSTSTELATVQGLDAVVKVLEPVALAVREISIHRNAWH